MERERIYLPNGDVGYFDRDNNKFITSSDIYSYDSGSGYINNGHDMYKLYPESGIVQEIGGEGRTYKHYPGPGVVYEVEFGKERRKERERERERSRSTYSGTSHYDSGSSSGYSDSGSRARQTASGHSASGSGSSRSFEIPAILPAPVSNFLKRRVFGIFDHFESPFPKMLNAIKRFRFFR